MFLNLSVGKFTQLTWHFDWFIRLLCLLWLANDIKESCLHIKAQETAASWLGILIGSFDWLHLLTVANNITWFDFGVYTPQLKELCQGSLVLLWNPKNSLKSRKSLKEWFSFISKWRLTACRSLAFNDQDGIRSQLERTGPNFSS